MTGPMKLLAALAGTAALAALLPGAAALVAQADEVMCVGSPPRQTSDPLSPPCTTFDGDNGGATAPGVTAGEIEVLVTLEGGVRYASSSDQTAAVTPQDRYYDLGLPASHYADQGDFGVHHVAVRALRAWQESFNTRYEFYDRDLRLTVYFTEGRPSADDLEAAAVANVAAVQPFAMVPLLDLAPSVTEAYIETVAAHGVTTFGDLRTLRESWLSALPAAMWNFSASIDTAAGLFADYACNTVATSGAVRNGPLAGDVIAAALDEPQERRFALLWNADYRHRGLVEGAEIVRDQLDACDVGLEGEAVVTECCWSRDSSRLPALEEMRQLQARGVTTILWAGGFDSRFTDAAAALGYHPEWILLGEGDLDNSNAMTYGATSPAFHDRSVTVTSRLFEEAGDDSVCARELHATDPSWTDGDLRYACAQYRPLFMLALAVQLAGPDLTAGSVEAGLRAIPAGPSSARQAPAFYLDGDHTMVKDAQLGRWDGSADHPASDAPGCFRAVEDGARHRAGSWTAPNIDSAWSATDPCDSHTASTRIALA